MFGAAFMSLLFCASVEQKETIVITNDSLKFKYYTYVLNGPNPAGTYIRFRMTDGDGRYWVEMINWGDVKKRFYPVVGNDHRAFIFLVRTHLLNDNPIMQATNFGNMGLVVRPEYAQLIKDLPLDIFFQTYFDEEGFLKKEHDNTIPEIMEYLFSRQVKFLHSANVGVMINRDYWMEIKNK